MYLFIAVVFFFLFSFVQRSQVQSLDNTIAKTLNQHKVTDTIRNDFVKHSINAIQFSKQKTEDSITRLEIRETLEKNKFIHGFSDEKTDPLVEVEDFRKNDIVSFDVATKTIDSLIAIDAPDEVIFTTMGMDADAGAFERRFAKQALRFYKSRKGGSILQTFYDTIPIAMFFLLPIFALILKILYRKQGLYAHHLVFSFYFFSFLFTVFSIILAVNFIVDIPDWIDWLVALSTFVYLYLALRRFYQQGIFKTFFKTSMTTFLFLLLVAPLTTFILGVFAFMFY